MSPPFWQSPSPRRRSTLPFLLCKGYRAAPAGRARLSVEMMPPLHRQPLPIERDRHCHRCRKYRPTSALRLPPLAAGTPLIASGGAVVRSTCCRHELPPCQYSAPPPAVAMPSLSPSLPSGQYSQRTGHCRRWAEGGCAVGENEAAGLDPDGHDQGVKPEPAAGVALAHRNLRPGRRDWAVADTAVAAFRQVEPSSPR